LKAPGRATVKDGQAVPLSNLALDEKSFAPQLVQ
tara:strand:- start:105 stop:206 length:102 start_codon:yes stop_codon:yes gene_type:complete